MAARDDASETGERYVRAQTLCAKATTVASVVLAGATIFLWKSTQTIARQTAENVAVVQGTLAQMKLEARPWLSARPDMERLDMQMQGKEPMRAMPFEMTNVGRLPALFVKTISLSQDATGKESRYRFSIPEGEKEEIASLIRNPARYQGGYWTMLPADIDRFAFGAVPVPTLRGKREATSRKYALYVGFIYMTADSTWFRQDVLYEARFHPPREEGTLVIPRAVERLRKPPPQQYDRTDPNALEHFLGDMTFP